MDYLLKCDLILAEAMQLADYLDESANRNFANEYPVDWLTKGGHALGFAFGEALDIWAGMVVQDSGKKWIKSHLRNYILREYQPITTISKDEKTGKFIGSYDAAADFPEPFEIKDHAPEWAKKAAENGSLVIIAGGRGYPYEEWDEFKEKIDHVVDYFNGNPDMRLDRLSVLGAIDASDKWLKSMMKKKIQDEDEAGLQEVRKYSGGFRWVRLISPQCLEREGKMMGHCVGGYSHAVMTGSSWIFSLRDSDGEAHCTVEYNPSSKTLRQAKGKQNKAVVEKYWEYVRDFLTNPPAGVVISNMYEEIGYLGLKSINGQLMDLKTLPDGLVVEGDFSMRGTVEYKLPKNMIVKGRLVLGGAYTKIPDGMKAKTFEPWGTLTEIGDDVTIEEGDLAFDKVKTIGKNFKCERDLTLGGEIESIGDGLTVGRKLIINRARGFKQFPKAMNIDRSIVMSMCDVPKIPDNLVVNSKIELSQCVVDEIGNGVKLGTALRISRSVIGRIGNEIKSKEVSFDKCEIKNMPKKLRIVGSAEFIECKIENMSDEVKVSGNLTIKDTAMNKIASWWAVGKSFIMSKSKAGNKEIEASDIKGEFKGVMV